MNVKILLFKLFVLKRWYICYYIIFITVPLSRLNPALKWRHCSQKKNVFLNFVEKYVRLKWILLSKYYYEYAIIIIEYAWICPSK